MWTTERLQARRQPMREVTAPYPPSFPTQTALCGLVLDEPDSSFCGFLDKAANRRIAQMRLVVMPGTLCLVGTF
jgi:hypothetical protein